MLHPVLRYGVNGASGSSLEDIGQVLGLERKRACGTTRALAAQRLQSVEAKLKDLIAVRDALAALIQECDEHGGVSCPILTRLSSSVEEGDMPSRSGSGRGRS